MAEDGCTIESSENNTLLALKLDGHHNLTILAFALHSSNTIEGEASIVVHLGTVLHDLHSVLIGIGGLIMKTEQGEIQSTPKKQTYKLQ